MNREDLVERGARAIAGLGPGDDWPSNDSLGGNVFTGTRDDEFRDAMVDTARECIDAVLPQVSTVAGLLALPTSTWLMGSISYGGPVLMQVNPNGLIDRGDGQLITADTAAEYGPFVVLWQPDLEDQS